MPRSWTTMAIGLCIAVLATSVQWASSQPRPVRLAFENNATGNWEIYVWDGSQAVNVSQSPTQDFHPRWSQDGRLAYLSATASLLSPNEERMANADVHVWDGKGNARVGRLAALSASDPIWSSDGRLAYVSSGRRVFVWDGQASIDVLPEASASNEPNWGPDGRLAFGALLQDGNQEIFIWDGGVTVNVSQHPRGDFNPVWGPGGKLAFTSYRDGPKRELYVWDGASLRNISQSPAGEYPPVSGWSARGMK